MDNENGFFSMKELFGKDKKTEFNGVLGLRIRQIGGALTADHLFERKSNRQKQKQNQG